MSRKLIAGSIVTLASLATLLGGAGCSGMKNGPMASVKPVTTQERVGSVYLLRGWIGVFSTGIDSLGEKINKQGVHAQVFQEAQWSQLADAIIEKYKDQPDHEPIVLVGHSYGADDSILVTRKLAEHDIRVALVVTLDPVTPRKVPSNANLVYNLYQSSALDALPFLRGIPLTADDPGPIALKNMNIRTDRTDLLEGNLDHFNIEKKDKVHDDVIAQVLKVCQPRAQWVTAHARRSTEVAAAMPARSSTPADVQVTSARITSVMASEPSGKGDAVVNP